ATKNGTKVSGINQIGGLIGISTGQSGFPNISVAVERSYSKAEVTATGTAIGGLIGSIAYTTITDSYSQGSVNTGVAAAQGNNIGGIAGTITSSSITFCYSTSNVCD